jgi:MSHA pilin protein MshD
MSTRIKRYQSGLSLIELVLFIVIIGVGVAGITVTYNTVVRGSADPMVRKQALAIADSLLLEIEQQAFTYCDPKDANVSTATSGAQCANDENKGGAAFPVPPAPPSPTPADESRGNPIKPYNNVADYAAYSAPASDILGGNAVGGYVATVSISRAGAAAPFASLPLDAVLRISVTVTGRGETVTLVGYRTRYAPNAAG